MKSGENCSSGFIHTEKMIIQHFPMQMYRDHKADVKRSKVNLRLLLEKKKKKKKKLGRT